MTKFQFAKVNSFVCLALVTCCCNSLFSQGEVPVNMFTGTPAIQIPLWSISDHDLSETIGIGYSSDGIKLVERTGIVGIGWNLSVNSYSVTREVRGLPDDFAGTGSDTRKGWFYNSNATTIGSFSNTSDLSSSSPCTDETADNTAINNFNYAADTEPDIFHYMAGDIGGSFVFDNNLNIRMIPYRDVKIEYTTVSPSDKKITSFTITTNTGVKYTFDVAVSLTRSAHKLTGAAPVEFLKREFQYYDINIFSPGVIYNAEWKLSKKESPTAASILYAYKTEDTSISYDTIRVGIRKSGGPESYASKDIYFIKESVSRRNIQSITSPAKEKAIFEIVNGNLQKVVIHDFRKSPSYVKEFDFEIAGFLKSVTEVSGCDKLLPYIFAYKNVADMPAMYSKSKDFWGYYNGKPNLKIYPKLYVYPSETLAEQIRITPKANHTGAEYIIDGADRNPDFASMQKGSLATITYPSGGTLAIDYEPNEYYDEAAAQTFIGGGLRVKSITQFDGINSQNNIVKTFEYKNAAGQCSGRLINRPVFAIPTREYRDPVGDAVKILSQFSGDPQLMYESLLVRVNRDLDEGEVIGYGRVKVSRTGAGSAEFEFALPAIYGNASSGDWIATQNKFARPGDCPSMEIVSAGGAWAFPFSPNPNFDHERGLMLKKTEKNEAGVKVRELTYTHQSIYKSGSTPFKVYGLAYDFYPYSTSNIYFFGKYFLLTDVEKTTSTETVVSYDAADQNKFVTSSSQYFYKSPAHKLLSRTRSTGIDGTIVTDSIKYPLDFGTIYSNSDQQLIAIKNLQLSFRNAIPIEQTTSIQRSGGTQKIVNASLIWFSNFGTTGKVLPYQQLSLKIDAGITDFAYSAMVPPGTLYTMSYDSRYKVDNTFLKFGEYDVPLSLIGNSRVPQSTVYGFRKSVPIVQVVNARYNEFAFSNFETDADSTSTGNEFSHSINVYPSGRTGNSAFGLIGTFSKTVTKASVSNYKFSLWLKKNSAAVDILVKLKDISSGAVYYTTTFNVNPSGTGFEYFEKIIPVTAAPASFVIEFQGQNIPGGNTPTIDDVAFLPENADLVSYTYDLPYGKSSVTDATGSTVFVTYDALGREKFVLDQDRNIVKKNTYKFATAQLPVLTANITVLNPVSTDPMVIHDLTEIGFAANSEPCIEDVKYEWDFGEGAGFQELTRVTSHTFTTIGNVQISVRKSHPNFAPVTTLINVNVIRRNLVGDICAKGAERVIQCGSTTINYYYCDQISATPASNKTIFKVLGIDVSEAIQSYSWLSSSDEGATWTTSSFAGTGETTNPMASPATYQIKCFITTYAGRTGYSNAITVTKEYCP